MMEDAMTESGGIIIWADSSPVMMEDDSENYQICKWEKKPGLSMDVGLDYRFGIMDELEIGQKMGIVTLTATSPTRYVNDADR
jgi:hypothetical protein